MKIKAIQRTGQSIKIIDQTVLPGRLKYDRLDTVNKVIAAIKRLKIRGAPAIGIAAAYGMAIAVSRSKRFDQKFVDKIASDLKNSRPTAVNLSWAVDSVVESLIRRNPKNLMEAKQLLWNEADRIHEEDRRMCLEIGKNGKIFVKNGDNVLTHCNTGVLATGGIGTALGIIYTCRDQGKQIHVYIDETRPVLQGARLTAWELKKEGIPSTLICDSTAGLLMSQKKVQHVIVGADRIAANGDVANKIGTYTLAVLAHRHNIPFYVAAPTSTFDKNLKSGDEITIEERSPDEVLKGFGKMTAPKGTKVFSPAFDITPRELISYYISDKEVAPGGRAGK